MKRNLVIAGTIATLGLAGLGTAGVTHALDASSSSQQNFMSDLAGAIAKKFNLKEADVQTIIDDQKSAVEQAREKEVKDEIAQLVTDKKLTQTQADAILAKRAELQKEREANKPSSTETEAERKAAMEARKAALDTWASENDIPTEYLHFVMGGPGGHGEPRDSTDDQSSSSDSST